MHSEQQIPVTGPLNASITPGVSAGMAAGTAGAFAEYPEPARKESGGRESTGNAEVLDFLELESLMLNMDASLRVHARPHFFSWTQGLLQSLIRHEVLVCALRSGEPMSFHIDAFSTLPSEPGRFAEVFRRDASVMPHIIRAWEENRFEPVVLEAGEGSPFAGSAMSRELIRIGATTLITHGTHDAAGQVTSFFTLACRAGSLGTRQAYLAQLVVPFLHTAWVRTQVNRPAESAGSRASDTGVLTTREREILKWIYHGKSNFEIGAILEISPLTVKNHVQKILRKLNVQNRTQAVGKALELRVLNF
jgi:transcriptional regulator EpsA